LGCLFQDAGFHFNLSAPLPVLDLAFQESDRDNDYFQYVYVEVTTAGHRLPPFLPSVTGARGDHFVLPEPCYPAVVPDHAPL